MASPLQATLTDRSRGNQERFVMCLSATHCSCLRSASSISLIRVVQKQQQHCAASAPLAPEAAQSPCAAAQFDGARSVLLQIFNAHLHFTPCCDGDHNALPCAPRAHVVCLCVPTPLELHCNACPWANGHQKNRTCRGCATILVDRLPRATRSSRASRTAHFCM